MDEKYNPGVWVSIPKEPRSRVKFDAISVIRYSPLSPPILSPRYVPYHRCSDARSSSVTRFYGQTFFFFFAFCYNDFPCAYKSASSTIPEYCIEIRRTDDQTINEKIGLAKNKKQYPFNNQLSLKHENDLYSIAN